MSDFSVYLAEVKKVLAVGNATEHTYRPAIEKLLEAVMPGIDAANEPKRRACGAPDFVVSKNSVPLGFVECKDVGVNLDKEEGSDQMRRYKDGLGNLILTDCLDFRWFVGGQKRLAARLATLSGKNAFVPVPNGEADVAALLSGFFQAVAPTVNTPKELAGRMAGQARLLRDAIVKAFEAEEDTGRLHKQMAGFRQTLLHTLTPAEFADMYAQTICYGLFAARVNVPDGQEFSRENAAWKLSVTNPFLRSTFGMMAGPEMPSELTWVVDDLVQLLKRADMSAILADFGHRTRQEDPVVHFYETFLAAYDPKMREARGVYYTPEPVVSYIVRSVDALLKSEFGLDEGLADSSTVRVTNAEGVVSDVHKVQILDPATGTGTFLHGVIDKIAEGFADNKGMWSGYVGTHLLPRLFGFEFLMAPYAVAHLKLGLQLKELGYDFQSEERLGVYLTNTLEEGGKLTGADLFAQHIAEEADAAGNVKSDAPVMVVLGNPPYSVSSQNKGEWITSLIDDYKTDLNEKKLNLDDDFIKFIRFAQWRIEQTGYGILAFITNHTYLDGITHRRMRESLMETFDDIYILDLHGNSKKKERSPDGSDDKNVFDIQQGVAIGLFVKKPGPKTTCTVHHAELWGKRESKYAFLNEKSVTDTEWQELPDVARKSCLGSFYFFTPKAFDNIDEYCEGWSVKEIFQEGTAGIETKRDNLAIQNTKENMASAIQDVINLDAEELRRKYKLPDDGRDWAVSFAKEDVGKNIDNRLIQSIIYRPFDKRWTYYTGKTRGLIGYPRKNIMRHMLHPNMALYVGRQGLAVGGDEWNLIYCGKFIEDYNLYRRGNNLCFPLYRYEEDTKATLFDADADNSTRRANIAPAFLAALTEKLNCTFVPDGKGDAENVVGPEDIFHYLYSVFHAPAYRARYAEFLKIDFPRLPLPPNLARFHALRTLGRELVGLHLMEHTGKRKPTYPDKGTDTVETVTWANGRVSINKTQGFDGVSADVWEFQVGGYQVCQKWLKDRKGRTLAYDDIRHYQAIVAALGETIRLMGEINGVMTGGGGWAWGGE